MSDQEPEAVIREPIYSLAAALDALDEADARVAALVAERDEGWRRVEVWKRKIEATRDSLQQAEARADALQETLKLIENAATEETFVDVDDVQAALRAALADRGQG